MEEIIEFLKNLSFDNDQKVKETLTKATTYYAYVIQEYANARSIRKIREAEEFLKLRESNGDKMTIKDKESLVISKLKSEIETEYTLEAITDALQQVMTTARKLLELTIAEKNYASQF